MPFNPPPPSSGWKHALMITVSLGLGACNTLDRLSEVGEPPKLTNIQDPTKTAGYKPLTLPMPAPLNPPPAANSLWRPGARAFFKDERASEVGDIITVVVNINDTGNLKNQTQTLTQNSEVANPNFTFFGEESSLSRVLPKAVNPASLFSFGSTGGINGTGTMQRQEQVTINLAAVITQKLPNGNLVISGRQELEVNSEMRILSVQGVIRPEDIVSNNTISSSQIAEARIVYGGKGTLTDIQTARYGQQIFDILAPF